MSDKKSLCIEDLKKIQAGPVAAVPTRYTAFIFFAIDDVQKFRDGFKTRISESITSSFDARTMRDEVMKCKARGEMATLAGINVSFSSPGLTKLLGLDHDPKDPSFTKGQFASAGDLGDKTTDWLPAFNGPSGHLDGFFEVTGYPGEHVVSVVQDKIMPLFKAGAASLKLDHYGKARPGNQKGHEHFGFNDGISQPFVKYADDDQQLPKRKSLPGQTVVDPGVLILGQPGDNVKRPDWATNGSFVVYRHLKQLVPEFNDFLRKTAIDLILDPHFPVGGTSTDELRKRIDFLGARLMGRWKSGLPVVFTPLTESDFPVDRPTVGKDKYVNNDFDYGTRGELPRNQSVCPFAAHARKTGPRTDISQESAEKHMIRRGGLPYGFEVQPEEAGKTRYERGLSFVCYQSSLNDGFEFIQKSWSNDPNFIRPSITGNIIPGFDPIIGQNKGNARTMTGFNAEDLPAQLTLPDQFILSQGGEYFFLPSIPTLKKMITPNGI